LDVALDNGAAILDTLDSYAPSNATPLLLAMQNFTDASYAPVFLNGEADSYLVIISDGMDTCGAEGVFNRNGATTPGELAGVATDLLEVFGIRTIVIGFGEGAEPDQLNAIAEAGGTEFVTYFDAQDGDQLAEALNTIAETVLVTCQFQIGTFDEDVVDLDLVNVYLDDEPIPRDDGCAVGVGWSWADDQRTSIVLCDEACDILETTIVDEIRVEIACTEDELIIV
jgi:hypothetical protein